MKDIREVYPTTKHSYGEYFWGPSDYTPLLESMGYPIVLRVDDDDYSGDSRLLFKDGDQYGMLLFGWGSCSGCDALQACGNYREIEELRERLLKIIHWGSAQELLDYIEHKDWEVEWSYHTKETRDFVAKAKEILKKAILTSPS